MKNLNFIIHTIFSALLFSCESDLDDPSNIGGGGSGSSLDGQLMFWTQSNLG